MTVDGPGGPTGPLFVRIIEESSVEKENTVQPDHVDRTHTYHSNA
jgi:hypothetical protein